MVSIIKQAGHNKHTHRKTQKHAVCTHTQSLGWLIEMSCNGRRRDWGETTEQLACVIVCISENTLTPLGGSPVGTASPEIVFAGME